MLYTGMIEAFIIVFILSAVGSLVLNMVFRFFGKKGYLGNLYPNVRGGIPYRAIGLPHLSPLRNIKSTAPAVSLRCRALFLTEI